MKTIFPYIGLFILMLMGCSNNTQTTGDERKDEESVLALLYQQQAAEYHALCLQGYNLARRQVDAALAAKGPHKPFAVVTDLDETALDNSAEDVTNYQQDTTYSPGSWQRWAIHGKPNALPGAVAFFIYAKSRGVHIYYVSNRDATDAVANAIRTRMDSLGFPDCKPGDTAHFRFLPVKAPTGSKETRRQAITKTDSIIVLLGDNLIDVDKAFDKKSRLTQTNELRIHEVDSLHDRWGTRYIVFPNAVYGDWENALYVAYQARHPGVKLNQRLKDSLRRALLQGAHF
jgi:5'-nucleotidase (lipoprotein e(P4) family)